MFVNGCFWHRHTNCRRATTPKTRIDFWEEKFESNVARDARNIADLEKLGWECLTIWECETTNEELLEKRLQGFLGSHTPRQISTKRETHGG